MIIILNRNDLMPPNQSVPANKLVVNHFIPTRRTLDRAELVVFLEANKVYVMKATKWPYGKPMSAAELLRYIAEHST